MDGEAVNPESQEPREMLPGDSGKLSLQKKGGNKIKQRKENQAFNMYLD